MHKVPFIKQANTAVVDTLPRSINTSITTLITILAIYFFGGASIQTFMLALFIGMFAGTYSSIFVASPLLVTWQERISK
jgi:preprotein translocase subunit SecF